jgi:NADH-quinone oxidoreductase subunit K
MIFIVLTAALFSLGLYGVLTRRHLVAILASVEVMLGGASVLFVGLATRTPTLEMTAAPGTTEAIGVLLIVTFAAEAAVALAIVLAAARLTGKTLADELTEVKG